MNENNILEVDFIKIDVQGHELPVLEGATNSIENVIGLELEVEFALLYQNQPLFSDIDYFVRERGFDLFDLSRKYYTRNENYEYKRSQGQLMWGDALYFRSPEQIVLMHEITQEKIIRSISIYIIYGYPELAKKLFDLADNKGKLTKGVRDLMFLLLSKYKDPIPNFWRKSKLRNLFFLIDQKILKDWE